MGRNGCHGRYRSGSIRPQQHASFRFQLITFLSGNPQIISNLFAASTMPVRYAVGRCRCIIRLNFRCVFYHSNPLDKFDSLAMARTQKENRNPSETWRALIDFPIELCSTVVVYRCTKFTSRPLGGNRKSSRLSLYRIKHESGGHGGRTRNPLLGN